MHLALWYVVLVCHQYVCKNCVGSVYVGGYGHLFFEFVLIPFMLTCSMMRFLSLLLLGLCPCGVSVVMWSSLICL